LGRDLDGGELRLQVGRKLSDEVARDAPADDLAQLEGDAETIDVIFADTVVDRQLVKNRS